MAKTDFVVDRIRSRLDEVNTANFQSKKLSLFCEFLKLCISNNIQKHFIVLACEFVVLFWY